MVSLAGTGQPTIIPFLASSRLWRPGRSEAWWWFGLPLIVAALLLAIHGVAPDFYRDYVLPEGYGILELSHFFMPLAGFFVCLAMLRRPTVRAGGPLRWAIVLFAIVCLYVAGEEMSWGQHFVHWQTPEYWAHLNRQDETNLHNISPWFNQRPRLVFEIALLVGGIIVPLVQLVTGPYRQPLLALLTPPVELVPTALMAALFKVIDHLNKNAIVEGLPARPSEAIETFEYLFILFYLIVLYRRVRALDEAGAGRVGL